MGLDCEMDCVDRHPQRWRQALRDGPPRRPEQRVQCTPFPARPAHAHPLPETPTVLPPTAPPSGDVQPPHPSPRLPPGLSVPRPSTSVPASAASVHKPQLPLAICHRAPNPSNPTSPRRRPILILPDKRTDTTAPTRRACDHRFFATWPLSRSDRVRPRGLRGCDMRRRR